MTTGLSRRALLLSVAATALSACAVPRGAPTRSEVIARPEAENADFALELVTRERLSLYPHWGTDTSHLTPDWPNGGVVPQDQRIAPGDRLSLRIWDASENSLLSNPGAQFADISNVTVTNSGHVALPYIEQVHVAGLTQTAARALVQERLTQIIPAAQVQMDVTQGRRNSVDIVGGVARPGTYPLSERNLPLTSLLSTAGGYDRTLPNPVVQITRGGRVYRRSLEQILANPSLDPPLNGGDRLVVLPDPRQFTALGAAGKEQVMRFDTDKVSALRAVSMMGGMADTRADPKGILVLRRYPVVQSGRSYPPPNERVVFSFDLTHAEGLFSADDFALQDGDLVMATQAPATTTQRVLGLFGAFLGTGRALSSL